MQENHPTGKKDTSKKSNGFSWGTIVFFVLVFGLIAYALSSPSRVKVKKLSFDQFKKHWNLGEVLTEQKDYPFQLVTKDDPYQAEIKGFILPSPKVKVQADQTQAFFVRVHAQLDQTVINLILSKQHRRRIIKNWADYLLTTPGAEELTIEELQGFLAQDRIIGLDSELGLEFLYTDQSSQALLVGKYRPVSEVMVAPLETEQEVKPVPFKVPVNLALVSNELKALVGDKAVPHRQINYVKSLLVGLLPILLLGLLLVFLFRQQMKMAGKGAMSFGQNRAKLVDNNNKVTFKDVAGVNEAKEELEEIVDFLRDPKKFQSLGGKIPKGVLMIGSPGTGKTLLARAVAGEAEVPFFSISGSDFVEMFVGVGASRVRNMFAQGRKSAPCLLFIDEIDAVGRHRGHGLGGGHDEREQTLNQLLVEMDGFDAQEGVIIIAATNRADVLDPALLRPGRFDRQVSIALPDVRGRTEILKIHGKKVKLVEKIDLEVIARGTPGFSGAELANLVNEAALIAVRKGSKAIEIIDLEESRDKVRWGRERRSLALSDKDKINTAYHEAGHAILNELLNDTDPLHKVTIIPRGPSLGSTMFLPKEDKFTYRKNELLDQLVVAMGGRVAEELIFGNVTNGAVGDIQMATKIARKMVCEWGMSEDLGMVEYGDSKDEVFLARDLGQNPSYSQATAEKIDLEIKQLVDRAHQKAKDLLVEHQKSLVSLAEALIKWETLEAVHVHELLESDEIKSLPRVATSPPPLPEEEETLGESLPENPDLVQDSKEELASENAKTSSQKEV